MSEEGAWVLFLVLAFTFFSYEMIWLDMPKEFFLVSSQLSLNAND